LAGGAGCKNGNERTHSPAAAEKKFLLDFFIKKSRVQGRALPLPAQGRQRRAAPSSVYLSRLEIRRAQ